jgi:hypothetical protein
MLLTVVNISGTIERLKTIISNKNVQGPEIGQDFARYNIKG